MFAQDKSAFNRNIQKVVEDVNSRIVAPVSTTSQCEVRLVLGRLPGLGLGLQDRVLGGWLVDHAVHPGAPITSSRGSENGGLKSIKMRIEVKHIPSRLNVRRVVFMHLEINPACPACCD